MDLEEVKRQRKIGQQLMLVNILKSIEEQQSRIGISFVDVQDLVTWTEMCEDEVRAFINQYNDFEKFELASGASKEYTRTKTHDHYMFFTAFFYRLGYIYYIGRSNNYEEPISVKKEQMIIESILSRYGFNINEEELVPTEIKKALDFFCHYYCNSIQEVINNGYDKEVVDKMLAAWNHPL